MKSKILEVFRPLLICFAGFGVAAFLAVCFGTVVPKQEKLDAFEQGVEFGLASAQENEAYVLCMYVLNEQIDKGLKEENGKYSILLKDEGEKKTFLVAVKALEKEEYAFEIEDRYHYAGEIPVKVAEVEYSMPVEYDQVFHRGVKAEDLILR
ncbi:MAG: hypothetical protein J5895_05160 [Alphaproteobacteria bacterium]|nr:hypothetical protein [Alphaproteobacteria bacterium]